jgi:hypothetical protein
MHQTENIMAKGFGPEDKDWRDLQTKVKTDFNKAAEGPQNESREQPAARHDLEPAAHEKMNGAEQDRYASKRLDSHRIENCRIRGTFDFEIG